MILNKFLIRFVTIQSRVKSITSPFERRFVRSFLNIFFFLSDIIYTHEYSDLARKSRETALKLRPSSLSIFNRYRFIPPGMKSFRQSAPFRPPHPGD